MALILCANGLLLSSSPLKSQYLFIYLLKY
jgi:hypothetical protein